ncbi:DUF302 domain-containing protein [Paraburkholderia sp. UYCP14C]|uniref:DUF302 domain-containing protein n=1 Tax=Paraburkholderia sp. UYCP14C TaxID=2511130 RepID=UPI002007188A|nr:DUF302 domain-containing protein [Paraburkholderia sp. UYCP14C]
MEAAVALAGRPYASFGFHQPPPAPIRLSVELPSPRVGTIGHAAAANAYTAVVRFTVGALPEHLVRTGGRMATASIAENASKGIVTVASAHAGDATAERLQSLIRERGLTVFASIDFSGDAACAGLTMPFSRLVIFGNPKAGTPLMQLAPTAALDLPLKVLVWEDADGRAWLSFNSTDYLRERHGLPDDLMKPVSGVAALVDAAAQ